MPKLNIYRSKSRGKSQTIYLDGLRVFRTKQGIYVSYEGKGNILYCQKGSDVAKFFDKILRLGA